MTDPAALIQRLSLIAVCYFMGLLAIFIFVVHLPFRIVQRLLSGRKMPAPPPKVEVTIREPEGTYTSPRDTLLFIHGFPDSPALFEASVAYFTKEGYRCLLVALPGSSGEPVEVVLSPDDLVDLIYKAVHEVHKGTVSGIGHDWGSFYTLLLNKKYPALYQRVIYLDVGMFRQLDVSAWLAVVAYQSLLAMLYMLGPPASNLVLRMFLSYMAYNVRPMGELTGDMCYPYVSVFREVVERIKEGKKRDRASTEGRENVPHLFLYGRKKFFNFHDAAWCDFVRKTPGGEVVGLPCGHWVSIEQPDETNKIISRWLVKTDAVTLKQ